MTGYVAVGTRKRRVIVWSDSGREILSSRLVMVDPGSRRGGDMII